MNMKVSLFITLAGPQVYCTLKNLMAPDSPNDKTYDDIIKVLKSHYVPEKSEIGERFTFNKCNQKSSQTVAEYIVELRRLANTCKFGALPLINAIKSQVKQ
ncbi:Retrotransposon gag protein [Popillia japonica]|uniref:Retrotransposon gag protein n=1 Tax=Popillia japonica TaxID=7064 RepID=A0AAW1JXQ5_POPJA